MFKIKTFLENEEHIFQHNFKIRYFKNEKFIRVTNLKTNLHANYHRNNSGCKYSLGQKL